MEKGKKTNKEYYKKLMGFSGIFKFHRSPLRNSSFWISLVLALLILFFAKNISGVYQFVVFFRDWTTTIMPGLVGFSLAGFAIIMSAGDKAVVAKLLIRNEKTGNTAYFSVLSTFGYIVLLHGVSLIIGLVVTFASWLDSEFFKIPSSQLTDNTNGFILLILSFLFIYSLLSLLDLISSVFSYGIAYGLMLKKVQKEESNEVNETVKKNSKED